MMIPSIQLLPYPHEFKMHASRRGPRLIRKIEPSFARADEYELTMTEAGTCLRAGSEDGLFYGEQTLQELPPRCCGYIRDWADVPLRIQMVDLKRIGWNFDYLLSLFPLFARFKINACLLEYEDKFPYRSAPEIPVAGAFSREQIRRLVKTAAAFHVEIIPLVQCFSHWEYILRHPGLASLREVPEEISQGCPLNPGTFNLFKVMLEEVLEMHPECRYVHIGADEARLLGHCPECAEKARKQGVERLWGDYVQKALDEVAAHGKIPLFWADFFWHHDGPQLHGDGIAVDWEYTQMSSRSRTVRIGGRSFAWGDKLDARYENCWRPDPVSGTLWGFPHQLWLKERGYRCWGASVAHSPDNVLAHAVAAFQEKNEAVLDTYWASLDSTTPPGSLFPWNLSGVGMLGAAAWNSDFESRHRDSFERRLAEKLSGPGASSEIYGMMTLAPMQFSEPPEIFGGEYSLWSRKKQLDFQMQNLFRNDLLFPRDCYDSVSLADRFNSDLDFTIGGKPCKFTVGSLNFMPQGEQIISGIPFELKNGLAVYGKFPGQDHIQENLVLEISRKRHPAILSVIQSYVGNESSSSEIGEVVFHYASSSQAVPLIAGENIHNWWDISTVGDNRVAFSNADDPDAVVRLGLHAWNCFNPHPELELQSVEFRMTQTAVVALAAVTLLEKSAAPCQQAISRITTLNRELTDLRERFKEEFLRYSTRESLADLDNAAFVPHEKYLAMLHRLVEV